MSIRWQLGGLKRLLGDLKMPGKSPRFRKAFKQWLFVYSAFIQRRFDRYSKGGGDWPDLAPATKAARRGKSSYKILRDTGTLFRALSIGARGNYAKIIRKGIRFGFSQARHSEGLTVADLADIHDKGKGRVPKRQILVQPDRATAKRMMNLLRSALRR